MQEAAMRMRKTFDFIGRRCTLRFLEVDSVSDGPVTTPPQALVFGTNSGLRDRVILP